MGWVYGDADGDVEDGMQSWSAGRTGLNGRRSLRLCRRKERRIMAQGIQLTAQQMVAAVSAQVEAMNDHDGRWSLSIVTFIS